MMRSLKARLLLGLAVGTLTVLVASGFVLYALIRAELVAEFDATLASEAHALATLVEEKNGRIQTELDEHGVAKFQPDGRPVHYQLWDREGKLVERSDSLGSSDLSRFGGTREQPEFRAVALLGEQRGRMVGIHFVPHQDAEDDSRANQPEADRRAKVTLVVARDTRRLEHTLRRIGLLLAGVIGGAVVVSIVVAAPIVRMSLHPLEKISAQIRALDINALAERLDSASAPDEVQAVIDCLNGLLDRLHDAFQRERAFSANVAHELRTPLAGLRSTIDVALAKPVESADYRRSLQRCLAICKQAESLTENLLVLARLDANQCQLRRETVSLEEVLVKAWAPQTTRANSHDLKIEWASDKSIKLTTDATLLSLIFRNLFDNAVSYADRGGHITVDASMTAGVATVCVCNSATRLPEDLEDHVFDRFWRADASRSGNGEHVGLGLSLCREAARVLDGRLAVTADESSFAAVLEFQSGK